MKIRFENVSYIYMPDSPLEKMALNNINLEIGNNEFIGIIGATGSGKTTLIQHLNGLLKPTNGNIFYDGKKADKEKIQKIRNDIGLVFQYPEYQLFEETVYKDIKFGIRNLELEKEEFDERIFKVATLVGIDKDILEKSVFDLSGGQKRRVAIAGVLIMEPKILVLDEPAAGLDPQGRENLYKLLKKLHYDQQITVVVVSHNMDDVARHTKRVIVMEEAKIAMDQTVENVFKDYKKLKQIGLDIPVMNQLMGKLKQKFGFINSNIYNIEAAKTELRKYLVKE